MPITDAKKGEALIAQVMQQYEAMVQKAEMEQEPEPDMPQIEQLTYADLVEEGLIETVSVPVQRVKM